MRLTLVATVVLGALCGFQNALAEDSKCPQGMIPTSDGQGCIISFSVPVKFGKDWSLRMKGTNSGVALAQLSWKLEPTEEDRAKGLWSVVAFVTADPPWVPMSCEGGGIILAPDNSNTLVFVPAGGCDAHGQNCQNAPDPTVEVGGVLECGWIGTADALRDVVLPTVELVNKDGTTITVTRKRVASGGERRGSIPVGHSEGSAGGSRR
jgi:hypothetical protein